MAELVSANSGEVAKYHQLFVTGARTFMMISKTALFCSLDEYCLKKACSVSQDLCQRYL